MNQGRNIFVCGRTGSGKTVWTVRQVETVERLFVYLPKREETAYRGVYFDGVRDRRSVPAASAASPCWNWLAYSAQRCGRFRVVYTPANKWDYGEFDRVCQGIYLLGNVTFIAEDLVGYTGGADLKAGHAAGFRSLLTDGRTRGITTYLVTQRPHGVPVEVRSECREARIFALNHAPDVDYIGKSFGDDVKAKWETIGQYQHVRWHETEAVEVQGP